MNERLRIKFQVLVKSESYFSVVVDRVDVGKERTVHGVGSKRIAVDDLLVTEENSFSSTLGV